MNVLFISSDNSKTSGAFLCMAELCKQLKEVYSVNVKVVLPFEGDGKPILDIYGIPSIVIKSCTWAVPMEWSGVQKTKFKLKMLVYNIPAIHKIRKLIRAEKIDIIHINTSWTYVGAVAALREKTPIVWHIRELLRQQQRRIAFQQFGYQLMRKANAIVSVSQFVGNAYCDVFGDKIHIIYDGVEGGRFDCKREILNRETVRILSVGGFSEQKGQLQVFEAIKKLKEAGYRNLELLVLGRGEGEYKQKLEKYVEDNNLCDMILFCGITSKTEPYYQQADIFTMTSRDEAFGRTTAEAMLSSCFVIGAKSGATPELIKDGETGMLYPHGDADALAAKIQYALEHKEQSSLIAKRGYVFAEENFTIKHNANKMVSVYKEFI